MFTAQQKTFIPFQELRGLQSLAFLKALALFCDSNVLQLTLAHPDSSSGTIAVLIWFPFGYVH